LRSLPLSHLFPYTTLFRSEFDGDFVAGQPLKGRMVPTQMDAEVAKSQEPYAGLEFVILVDRLEPMRLFSFRWNPYEIEPGRDPLDRKSTRLNSSHVKISYA